MVSRAPLAGVRVLDLSRVLAGPFCTMLLSDMGAEVIKVERPGLGDDTRSWGPPFFDRQASTYFLSVNRNKKSLAVDIKHPQGSGLLHELAKKSDVLLENYLPGKLKSFGLDYATLSDVNPNLVYCSITGFGQHGPLAQRAGYDVIAAAMGGLLHITGTPQEPCKVGVAVTDLLTGLFAVSHILAALLPVPHSSHAARGCHIDCNLLASQVATLTHIAANYLVANVEASRFGMAHPNIVPYQTFLTRDKKHLVVGAGNDAHFDTLCQLLNLPHLPADARFGRNSDRVKNRQSLIPLLEEQFLTQDLEHWLSVLEKTSLPHGNINPIQEVFANPQVQYLAQYQHLLQTWSHPKMHGGKPFQLVGPPVACSSWDPVVQRPPPLLGEHTREVLCSVLGYTNHTVNQLVANGVVQESGASD